MICSPILQNILDFLPHNLCACILSGKEGKVIGVNTRANAFFNELAVDFENKNLPQIFNKMGVKHADFILNDPPDGEARTFTLHKRTFVSFRKFLQNGDFGLTFGGSTGVSAEERLHLIFWCEIPYQHGEKYELLLHEFEITLDSIHDGIWIIDGNGMTLHANKALKRIAGIRAKDVVGKHVTVPMLEGKFTSCVTLDALSQRKTVTQFDDYSNGNRCLNTSTPIMGPDGSVHRVVASIRNMTELEALQDKVAKVELEALRYKGELAKIEQESSFVGISSAYHDTVRQLKKVAKSVSAVLIMGETGTGKSLAASFIHEHSDRKEKPFIAINCAAIAESLIDSELFGYEKGAFTGADPQGKKGYFELADGGTLLLDEIGELPLNMQAKLLHVLDNYSFHKVGGNKSINVNVRIIAATNRPLEELVQKGEFRKDLYYRLHILTVNIPPLRERPDDIPLLANSFLSDACRRLGTNKVLHNKALLALSVYHWPGNVRELRGAVEYLVAMSEGSTIKVEHIRPYILGVDSNYDAENIEQNEDIHALDNDTQSYVNNTLSKKLLDVGFDQEYPNTQKSDQRECPENGYDAIADATYIEHEMHDKVGAVNNEHAHNEHREHCQAHIISHVNGYTISSQNTNNLGHIQSTNGVNINPYDATGLVPYYSHVPTFASMPTNLNDAVAELEKYMIRNALVQGGSTYKASEILGISQSSVVRKAKSLGIKV